MVVRTVAVRTLLHSIAANLWPDDEWPGLLAGALRALGTVGDEPRPEEERAAGSLAAVSLALLRNQVARMSVRDEPHMRYVPAGTAVVGLLYHRDAQQIELLAVDLPGRLAGPPGAQVAERAVREILHPPRGVDRAVLLLAEERDTGAHTRGDAAIVIDDPLGGLPEPMMILALRLPDDTGPGVRPRHHHRRPAHSRRLVRAVAGDRTRRQDRTGVRPRPGISARDRRCTASTSLANCPVPNAAGTPASRGPSRSTTSWRWPTATDSAERSRAPPAAPRRMPQRPADHHR